MRRYAEMIKKQICLGSGSTRRLAKAKSVQYKGEETAPRRETLLLKEGGKNGFLD